MISRDTQWNLGLKPLAGLLILVQKASLRVWLLIATVLYDMFEVVPGGKWYYSPLSPYSVSLLTAQLVASDLYILPTLLWGVFRPTTKKR